MSITMTGVGRRLGIVPFKTNGITVQRDVYALISAANVARNAREWRLAADSYAAALERAPDLRHIWIQYGHAEKEAGNTVAAAAGYAAAERLGDEDGEAAFNLGRLARVNGDRRAARRHLLRAIQHNPRHADAFGEFRSMIDRKAGIDDETMRLVMDAANVKARSAPAPDIGGMMDRLIAEASTLAPEDRAKLDAARLLLTTLEQRSDPNGEYAKNNPAGSTAIVFDASDLISYFRNARLPTGIQRVQIETIGNALMRVGGPPVQVCCFTEGDDDWVEIPAESFLELSALSVVSGDRTQPEWLAALSRLYLHLTVAEPFDFPEGACLVNLGTSWWLQNYFLYVRQAKRTRNIRYVPFVHDLIPVMTPQHCVKELTQDFITWALGVFEHADFFLANSNSTKRDLIKVGDMLGHSVPPENVAVIPLDADFRRPLAKPLDPDHLRRWYLAPGEFVLIVSTIESRKNHLLAFEAWVNLMRTHGADKIPKLVCVGNRGWLNDEIYRRLEDTPLLRQRVVMLSHLSDEELALLYRNCLFTLYPSTYEGWGLPVTESLCYGKVALVSDSSSLPEAGGRFADYFESISLESLEAGLRRLIFDPAHREAREHDIRENFEPRRWLDIADQIEDSIVAFVKRSPHASAAAPRVVPGAYHPIQRNYERRIWRGMAAGEVYRGDTGWWWPDAWGCWTKPEGGTLRFSIPGDGTRFRAYLKLLAPDGGATEFEIYVEQNATLKTGTVEAGASRWLALDLIVRKPGQTDFSICIKGSHWLSLGDRTEGLDQREIALGLAGFFVCDASNYAHRAEIAEAIALNDEMALAFNREREDGGAAS